MAFSSSPNAETPAANASTTAAATHTSQSSQIQVSSSPVELSDLSARQQNDQSQTPPTQTPSTPSASAPAPETSAVPSTSQAQQPPVTRQETGAIGPALDQPTPVADNSAGPVLMITLLLPSGARHPFKIDEKYLKKRSINVEGGNPMNISVYNMKELIWRDWRGEWEPRPTSPTYIRLIFFGAMLDDKAVLEECKFNTEAPNVVHMSVKPQEIVEEEDVKNTKSHGRGSEGERRGLNCCVIL